MICKVLCVYLFLKVLKILVKLILILKIDCVGVFLCMCNFFENFELFMNIKYVILKICVYLKYI